MENCYKSSRPEFIIIYGRRRVGKTELIQKSLENKYGAYFLAGSYRNYSFSGPITGRIEIIRQELDRRRVDGVIHYTQFACHHTLEDEIFRTHLDYPVLTVQGDLPHPSSEQLKLRLEAFSEMLEVMP